MRSVTFYRKRTLRLSGLRVNQLHNQDRSNPFVIAVGDVGTDFAVAGHAAGTGYEDAGFAGGVALGYQE